MCCLTGHAGALDEIYRLSRARRVATETAQTPGFHQVQPEAKGPLQATQTKQAISASQEDPAIESPPGNIRPRGWTWGRARPGDVHASGEDKILSPANPQEGPMEVPLGTWERDTARAHAHSHRAPREGPHNRRKTPVSHMRGAAASSHRGLPTHITTDKSAPQRGPISPADR